MKTSIAYLPEQKQKELHFLVDEILRRLPQAQFIILYGSYARDNYVRRSLRIEHGQIPTVKVSDYDILVITDGIDNRDAEHILDCVDDLFFAGKDIDRDTPVEFINYDIRLVNKYLQEGRYFYTQVKKEGIVLYDSGNFSLARRRKLDFNEIQKQAREYFDDKFAKGNGFLRQALHARNDQDHKIAAFDLHQACESYYRAIRLTFTLQSGKQHNLAKLSSSVRKYSDDLANVFPLDTTENKRLFKLLKSAYVDARYNPDFEVKGEDIDALIPRVELLRDITRRVCEAAIAEYGKQE